MTAVDSLPGCIATLDALPHAALLVNAAGFERTIVHANPAFAALTGRDAAACRGRSPLFMLGEHNDAIRVQQLREAIAAAKAHATELQIEAGDAATLSARISLQPFATTHLLVIVEDLSRLVRLRESLRTSEARLQVAMDGSALSMWEWNVERDEVYYNDQWRHTLGIDPAELLQRRELHDRLLLPLDRLDVLDRFEQHFRGSIAHFEGEYELALPSGKRKWFSARADVVQRDAKGNALRMIGVLQDISPRRVDADRADEVQERWERAVRGTSDGLYDWNLHTGHVWYADRFREIVGYGEEDFPDTFSAFQNVLHPDDRALVLHKIRRHLENQSPLDVRCRVVTRSGTALWCRMRGQAARDAAGRPLRLSGSISDVTAQIEAEAALGRSQNFYGTILDSLPLYVAYVDHDEKLVYANRPFQQFFRRSLASTRGHAVRDVIGERRYDAVGARFREALTGRTVEAHGQLRGKNGQPVDMEGIFLPHFDEAGQVLGCFVAARDVTEKKQLEAELRQSQKMEAVGRLTGGIAHDFNNLLAVIIGNMQLLARGLREQPRLLRQAETSMKAAIRGADLTRRLLAFARQQVLEPRVVDLGTLIGGMYELLRRSMTGDIEIRLVTAPTVWPVKIDPGQLENAVLNLVINARDAMPGGGAIIIRTHNETVTGAAIEAGGAREMKVKPGDYAVLEVVDTGTGMAPDTLKRAFEPFFTTKDVGKGSGLGLPMVYGFVRQSGGELRVDSTVGKGTTVQLYLPRAPGQSVAAPREAAPAGELSPGWETILVVEDNPEVRTTAVDILSSLGYRVLEAGNGYQALDRFMQHTDIALVFSDVMLPGGLPGPLLVEKLRERRPDLKVLMTSAFSESSILSRQMLDGSLQLLTKPYRVEDLARYVRAILDEKEEKSSAPA
ncbi:MAG TPA: PAS domain-containing protein [Povalibacter sp.]|uniref:hybrid sensor histidine kinase/response regulator n=1 Tax=Povalibacter sp. TaxID=1962978 RepID=UPI002CDD3BD5|nr:PAS domain-containing protein [Povalibacter sp.]HMN44012.1 PAS domain-containing protein [Povalibacter sp.]